VEQRTVGRSGLRVSSVGLGTLTWGRDTDADEAAAQLVAFVDAGGTLVDVSPAYGEGAALEVLTGLVGDLVPRADLVLSASSGHVQGADGPALDCSRRTLLAQLDATLAALGTDHLDLWQVAGWDPLTPVGEVAATLAHALVTGRTRYVGVRGHRGWQLATAAAIPGLVLTSAQAQYSLLARGVEAELAGAAAHHGVGLLAAVPLARGVLTGKYRDGTPADSRGASPHLAAAVEAHRTPHAARVVEAVVTAADGLATSPLAVALAWVRDRPGVASALVGCRDSAQLAGVLAASGLVLPEAIRAALDDVSAA
jgi:aryl-alcohol dehydrogenase-like predicted oxidoreductase